MSKTKQKPPTCETPFPENNLPWPCQYYPPREKVHEVVTDIERAKASELLSEYRASEEAARLNDIHGFAQTIARCEFEKNHVDAQAARVARDKADHVRFLAAQANLYQLRERAADLVIPILARLRDTFHEELMATALEREAGLVKLGIPLFVEDRSGASLVPGDQGLQFPRIWKLSSDEEVKARYAFREVASNLLSMFQNGWRGHTNGEIRQERAIRTLQFLATDESVGDFSWT
jgi:hypothetical protein